MGLWARCRDVKHALAVRVGSAFGPWLIHRNTLIRIGELQVGFFVTKVSRIQRSEKLKFCTCTWREAVDASHTRVFSIAARHFCGTVRLPSRKALPSYLNYNASGVWWHVTILHPEASSAVSATQASVQQECVCITFIHTPPKHSVIWCVLRQMHTHSNSERLRQLQAACIQGNQVTFQ